MCCLLSSQGEVGRDQGLCFSGGTLPFLVVFPFLREIPLELQRLVRGGHVNLDMEDHQDQEYVKPRLRFKAFSGEGQKLGR